MSTESTNTERMLSQVTEPAGVQEGIFEEEQGLDEGAMEKMPHLKTQDRQYLGGKTKEEQEAEPEPTCLGPVGDRAQHCCSRATLPGLAGGQPRPSGLHPPLT